MSYCVECGVKLADSENICPLCNTEVLNPNVRQTHENQEVKRPYPSQVELQKSHVNRHNLAMISMLFLLIPVGVTLVIDLLADLALTWSLLVTGAAALMFIIVMIPVVSFKPNAYVCIALDSAAICGYLSIIACVIDKWRWCLLIGMPISVLIGLIACAITFVLRTKLGVFAKAGWAFIIFSWMFFFIETIINCASRGRFEINWSIYVITPLILITVLLFYINGKHGLIDELHRRLFT